MNWEIWPADFGPIQIPYGWVDGAAFVFFFPSSVIMAHKRRWHQMVVVIVVILVFVSI